MLFEKIFPTEVTSLTNSPKEEELTCAEPEKERSFTLFWENGNKFELICTDKGVSFCPFPASPERDVHQRGP